MIKLTTISIAAVAVSIMASAAYASDTLVQQRLADENAAYFHQMDKGSAATVMHGTDMAASPQQRNAERDAEYWGKVGYPKAQVTPSNEYHSGFHGKD